MYSKRQKAYLLIQFKKEMKLGKFKPTLFSVFLIPIDRSPACVNFWKQIFDLPITVGASCSHNVTKNHTLFIHLGHVFLPTCSMCLFSLECFSQGESNKAFSISGLLFSKLNSHNGGNVPLLKSANQSLRCESNWPM